MRQIIIIIIMPVYLVCNTTCLSTKFHNRRFGDTLLRRFPPPHTQHTHHVSTPTHHCPLLLCQRIESLRLNPIQFLLEHFLQPHTQPTVAVRARYSHHPLKIWQKLVSDRNRSTHQALPTFTRSFLLPRKQFVVVIIMLVQMPQVRRLTHNHTRSDITTPSSRSRNNNTQPVSTT